jgi:hypothetical protein
LQDLLPPGRERINQGQQFDELQRQQKHPDGAPRDENESGLRSRAISLLMRRPRQYDPDQATSFLGTVGDLDPPSMGLGNLAREDKSNAAAARFCRVERSEDIRRI